MALEQWHLLDSGSGHYAFNMAADEALLEAMPRLAIPVLRFYGWEQPAVSFGYFQKYADIQKATLLRPLVRRPTGGGLVPHDADWTYSLVIPTLHEWYSVSAVESYRRAHEWIQAAFAKLRVDTFLAPDTRRARPGECFAGHERFDLLWAGRKIAGAAQRRARCGLLIQGSVQPVAPAFQRTAWQQAMLEVGSERGFLWTDFLPDLALQRRIQQLQQTKYSSPAHNQKR